ncbi:hypothetical protein GH714_020498 [Hevea brasiliensis]|uniref:Reverse transcriptase Ty1/copia-type domain-containing protein n=1 Tax=Hevea brasiliensis TaxID=3981 RepID=A0A6A6N5V5_HEVBR|nr:hypothetical protein GH714_020498 [Hevea brasiliensis]
MALDYVQLAIPCFDGYYDHWSILMENFLRSKEYWHIVTVGVVESAAGSILSEAQKPELESSKLKDLKVKNYLFHAIDHPILETILCKDTSKQIQDSIKRKYQGNARTKRAQLQILRGEFETLCMKSGETVLEYFSRMMAIVNKMRIHGERLKDVTIMEKILCSMIVKFNVACSIKDSKDIDALLIDELQSSLLLHKQKINQQEKEEQALKVATNSKGDGHEKGKWEGKNGHHKNEKSRAGNDRVMFENFKRSMVLEFDMSDLAMMHYFLGIEVSQCADGIFISQKKYVRESLDRFWLKDCNSVKSPIEFSLKLTKDSNGRKVGSTLDKHTVGSLMYLTGTSPDVMYVVSLIRRLTFDLASHPTTTSSSLFIDDVKNLLATISVHPTMIVVDDHEISTLPRHKRKIKVQFVIKK